GIGGTFYVLVFTDSTASGQSGKFGIAPGGGMGLVPEFQGEGNNITAGLLPVSFTPPPDLRVSAVTFQGPDPALPGHVLAGQSFTVTYTVANAGSGDTPDRQSTWPDHVYLSRDPFLSDADLFFAAKTHTGGLKAGSTYSNTLTLKAARDLSGPW